MTGDGAGSDENTSSPGSTQKMPTDSPTQCQNSSFENIEEIIPPTSSAFVPSVPLGDIGPEGDGGVSPSPSFTHSNIIISKSPPTKDITKLMESGAHIEALTSNNSHIPSISKFPHFNEQDVFDMCSSSQVIKKSFPFCQ